MTHRKPRPLWKQILWPLRLPLLAAALMVLWPLTLAVSWTAVIVWFAWHHSRTPSPARAKR